MAPALLGLGQPVRATSATLVLELRDSFTHAMGNAEICSKKGNVAPPVILGIVLSTMSGPVAGADSGRCGKAWQATWCDIAKMAHFVAGYQDAGVICQARGVPSAVIPAQAGIQSLFGAFPKICEVDSRLRGNDWTCKCLYLVDGTAIVSKVRLTFSRTWKIICFKVIDVCIFSEEMCRLKRTTGLSRRGK